MTRQEAEWAFREALNTAIENARANDLADDTIGYHLRSIAATVSKRCHAELDRRNAQRIAEMRRTAE
jgi:hypothetical protein